MALPEFGQGEVDLDKLANAFSQTFTLANWSWNIRAWQALNTTETPLMVRLIAWMRSARECDSLVGESRDERRLRLRDANHAMLHGYI